MIFAVEDDDSIREIEVYTLTSVGFKAMGFPNGQALFEALKGTIPELIILDIMLPGEDGVSILRRLRQKREYSSIPVIMATAKGSEYDKVESLDCGADDYLVKPFGMMEASRAALGESWHRLLARDPPRPHLAPGGRH